MNPSCMLLRECYSQRGPILFGGRIQNSISLTLEDDYEHTFQASTRSGEHSIFGPRREKTCLRRMQSKKAQTSLGICAV